MVFPAGLGSGEAEGLCQPLSAELAVMDQGFGLSAMSSCPEGREHQASYTRSHFARVQAYFLASPGVEMSPV